MPTDQTQTPSVNKPTPRRKFGSPVSLHALGRYNANQYRRVGFWLLMGVLVIGPQLLGGVPDWSQWVISVASVASFVLVWISQRRLKLKPMPWFLLAFTMIGSAMTLLQAIPMPCFVVNLLAPYSAEAEQQAFALTGGKGQLWMCALSMDPAATRMKVVQGAGVICVLFSTWLLSQLGFRRWIVKTLGFSTGLMACVTLWHSLLGIHGVFGLYQPETQSVRALVAPFINTNHLSGFFAAGVPLLIGLSMTTRKEGARVMWISLTIIVIGVLLLTLSRGGIGAMAGSLTLFVALWMVRKMKRKNRNINPGPGEFKKRTKQFFWRLVKASWPLAFGVSLGIYVAFDKWLTEFRQDNFWQKLSIAMDSLLFSLKQPLLGVGRGAFGSTYTLAGATEVQFEYPENIVAQWIAEWGPIVGLIVLCLGARSLYAIMKRARGPVSIGLISSLAAFVLHDLVDFLLETSAGASYAAAVLGCASVTVAVRGRKTAKPVYAIRTKKFMPHFAVASAALVFFLGLTRVASSPAYAQRKLARLLDAKDTSTAVAYSKKAIRLHPSSAAIALMGGALLHNRRDPEALRWYNHAMTWAPGWAYPHVYAARWLADHGQLDQAALEIRQAESRSSTSAFNEVCRWLKFTDRVPVNEANQAREQALIDALLLGAPRKRDASLRYWNSLAQCPAVSSTITSAIDDEILKRNSGAIEARVRMAMRLIQTRKSPDEPLTPSTERGLAQLNTLVEEAPESGLARRTLALAYYQLLDAQRAVKVLERAEIHMGRTFENLELEAQIHASVKDHVKMRATMQELHDLCESSADKLGRVYLLWGRLERKLGFDATALNWFEESYRYVPDVNTLFEISQSARNTRNYIRARTALQEVLDRDPDNPLARTKLAEIMSELSTRGLALQ